jgi:tripartite ATP-independent transporter DctM subunit
VTLDRETIGLIGIAAMLVLLALRMPIGIAMLLVGISGFAWLNGVPAALSALGNAPYSYSTVYDLAVIPLFVLMGNCAAVSGMSRDLYSAAYAWLGHLRGGLASATIAACAGFAAVSGSSVASAVTMGRVCLPEMKRYGYDDGLAAGTVAAGGTLGILIPPSTAFVIYAILTEQSIGKLLLAGFFPGILLALLFIITVAIWTRFRPDLGPPGKRASRDERMRTLLDAGPMVVIVAVSIGGIYLGLFTPGEAAAVGALLSFVLAFWRRTITWMSLSSILLETVKTTAFVFLILIGAFVFGPFLALSGLPEQLAKWLVSMDVQRYVVLTFIIFIYIGLGMFLEGFSILVLTLAIVVPIIEALHFDLIWFGVIMVIVLEMGLISPPVGINVFVVKGLVPDTPIGTIFKGVLPFWAAMGICILLLVLFPQIALVVPNTMIR